MVVLLFIVVIGWGVLLDRLVNLARQEVGMEKAAPGSNLAVFACWIPMVSIIGICFPVIFLGKDLVHNLKNRGNKGRWFNYIRMGAFAYLVLLLVVPLLLALAGHS